jgi:hypothetical protein
VKILTLTLALGNKNNRREPSPHVNAAPQGRWMIFRGDSEHRGHIADSDEASEKLRSLLAVLRASAPNLLC